MCQKKRLASYTHIDWFTGFLMLNFVNLTVWIERTAASRALKKKKSHVFIQGLSVLHSRNETWKEEGMQHVCF